MSELQFGIFGFKGDVNVPVCCGGCVVCPGDLILGNSDGIVVVPYDFAEKLIEIAEMYEEYNKIDQAGFANNLPLTEIMSFERKIEKMPDVIYLE